MTETARQVRSPVRPDGNASPASSGRAVASAIATLATERDGLEVLRSALEGRLGEAFAHAVGLAAQARGRIIVTGMGKSGHVARKTAATLASTGTPAHYVHPAEASHGDLGMIQPDDVVLAISWSGETRELSDIISYAKRFRVGLVAMTADPESALGRQASVCLTIPKAREACPNGLAPTTSTTMQLALGDAFAVALLEQRGFSAQDYHVLHPGGRLGAQLRHVATVMHRGDRIPLVPVDASMAEALVIQSEKGFGCVIAVDPAGEVAGIVTDGDLRRHMGGDLLTKRVSEVMTPNPIVISPDLLLGEAIEIVESRGRSALVVVENRRPVGIVHVLDLLRAGVA